MTAAAKYRIEGEDATAAAFKSIVGNANKSAEGVKHAFEAAFAGISVAAVAELGKKAFEMGDQLSKAAIKAGISGKAFSELAYGAKLADVDVQALSTSIKKMQVSLSEASTGAKVPTDALAALGLKIKDLKGLDADKQFEIIAERIHELKDPADKARAAVDLFGKAGAELLPLFEQGAAGIAKARGEAEQLGVVLGDEGLKKLSEAEDAIKRLTSAWQGFYMTLATHVAPTVTNVLDSLSGTRAAELKQQIAFLEKVQGEGFVAVNPLGSHGAYKDIAGVHSADEGAALLEKLRGELDLRENLHPELGGRGVHTGMPQGYKAGADAAATKLADAADEKVRARISDTSKDFADLYKTVNSEADKSLKEDMDREAKRLNASDEFFEKQKQQARDLEVFRANEAEASAQKYVDLFNGAFDAMEQNGHLSIKRLAQYVLVEFAQLATAKIIKSLFSSATSSSGSSGGGLLSGIASAIGGLFGGTRDSGGSGEAGKSYLIGRGAQPELFIPRGPGTFVPNGKAGGGGVTIHYAPVINNPKDTDALPQILRENNRQLLDDLDRRGLLRQA